MTFRRCRSCFAEETSCTWLCVAHHILLHFIGAGSRKTKCARSACIWPECRVISERIGRFCSALTVAAINYLCKESAFYQKNIKPKKITTYNPAGHRIFGLANPSLEHTKPVSLNVESDCFVYIYILHEKRKTYPESK